jgi:hypothetical protein
VAVSNRLRVGGHGQGAVFPERLLTACRAGATQRNRYG